MRSQAGTLYEIYNLMYQASHAEPWQAFFQTLKAHYPYLAPEQFEKFIQGFSTYLQIPDIARHDDQVPIIGQAGAVCIRDYGAKYGVNQSAQPVLFVPSLINKGYILDLLPGVSLFEFLASQNLRPLLLDWGEPGLEESQFNLDQYVSERLVPLLIATEKYYGQPPIVIGYCMGGILLLKAITQYNKMRGIGFLAVPGDLSVYQPPFKEFYSFIEMLKAHFQFNWNTLIPAWALQLYFHALNPHEVFQKFTALAEGTLSPGRQRKFVAIEDWLNDGVPLAFKVAADLTGLHDSERKQPVLSVQAEQLPSSIFAVMPNEDKIVPIRSAEALIKLLPRAKVLRPDLGHVGMIISSQAKEKVWQPLVQWMDTLVY